MGLERIDVATGVVLGAARRPDPLPASDEPALAALERAVLPALQRPPCLVSFSGGRDSSAVLAVAIRAARRAGLPDPIPATNRFRTAAAADERGWQERVIAHLGIDEWVRLTFDDELDVVGPYARRVLRRHGLLWPFNVHFHLPLLDAARGGSVLTGIGGDELFTAAGAARLKRTPRGLAKAAFELAPYGVRRPVLLRRAPFTLPWLTPEGRRAAAGAGARHDASEPRAVPARLAWARGMRALAVGPPLLEAVARGAGAQIVNPLLDDGVWAAVAREAGRRGFASRAEGMARVFGDVLPAEVVDRPDKACFDEAFFTATAREVAAAWDGRGVPRELVDEDALAAEWRRAFPMAQSFTLLQAAWLASAARRGDKPLGGLGHRLPAARSA